MSNEQKQWYQIMVVNFHLKPKLSGLQHWIGEEAVKKGCLFFGIHNEIEGLSCVLQELDRLLRGSAHILYGVTPVRRVTQRGEGRGNVDSNIAEVV